MNVKMRELLLLQHFDEAQDGNKVQYQIEYSQIYKTKTDIAMACYILQGQPKLALQPDNLT